MSQPRATYAVTAPQRRRPVRPRPPSAEAAGFPGCKAVPMTAAELIADDAPRIEYWDAEEGFAWMVREGAGFEHEFRGHRLPVLLYTIAQARGADIVCGGTTSFYERGPGGEHIRAMAADQTVFLDAPRAWTLPPQPTVLGEDPVPDVVLEVDHTTDVRRRKLGHYEKWRFPEVWVEVPAAPHRSRPRSRPSALTIHVLDEETGRYAEAAASRAQAGWMAAEIHLALNERQRSAATWRALERVGRALGEQGGTEPADDPLMRGLLADAERRATIATVLQVLTQRGIAHAEDLLADGELLARAGRGATVAAALACHSEADFLMRLGAPSAGT